MKAAGEPGYTACRGREHEPRKQRCMYLALEHYDRPTTVEQCLRLLQGAGERAAILAGGTELNVRGHEELTRVVDLQGLGLDQLRVEGARPRIGAALTLSRILELPELEGAPYRALREACAAFANVAIQNRSTIGGRVMSDSPDQDLPCALAVLGARLRLARLAGDQVREETIDYPTDPAARAALRGALLLEVELPPAHGSSALRRSGRSAVDVPLAVVAAARNEADLRLAANLQGGTAAESLRRLPATEALAKDWGDARPADWRAQARGALLEELVAFHDARASGEYRRDLGATLGVRALAAVFGEDERI